MEAPGTPSDPFLSQVRALEEKLRMAQPAAAAAPPTPPAPLQRYDTMEQASPALREASDVRAMLQRSLVAKAQQQQQENEGLSQRVSLLDQSLRASEAARKREAALRSEELEEMKQQLETERRKRAEYEEEEPPTAGRGGSPRGFRSREWRLRAELAEATHEAAAARNASAQQAEDHGRANAELAARATHATQGVLKLQHEVRASLAERDALVAQVCANDERARRPSSASVC